LKAVSQGYKSFFLCLLQEEGFNLYSNYTQEFKDYQKSSRLWGKFMPSVPLFGRQSHKFGSKFWCSGIAICMATKRLACDTRAPKSFFQGLDNSYFGVFRPIFVSEVPIYIFF